VIPEIVSVHLESEVSRNGVNRQRRTTRRFGPKRQYAVRGPDPPGTKRGRTGPKSEELQF